MASSPALCARESSLVSRRRVTSPCNGLARARHRLRAQVETERTLCQSPLNCLDNLRLLERARLVIVDHRKYLSGRVQKLETELFIGFLGRALAALALLGELREALLQAALDGGFPVCVRSYASTSRRRRVDGVEATSDAVDASLRVTPCHERHGIIKDAAKRAIPQCQFPPSRPHQAPPTPS